MIAKRNTTWALDHPVGYYLMAAIAPKHLRCLPGEERIVVSNSPIKKGQVNITHIFETDFQNFPCKNQPQLLPGFWTIGGYKPLDTAAYDWQVVPDKDYWIYGPGMNGSHGTGLLQDQKVFLAYLPVQTYLKQPPGRLAAWLAPLLAGILLDCKSPMLPDVCPECVSHGLPA